MTTPQLYPTLSETPPRPRTLPSFATARRTEHGRATLATLRRELLATTRVLHRTNTKQRHADAARTRVDAHAWRQQCRDHTRRLIEAFVAA